MKASGKLSLATFTLPENNTAFTLQHTLFLLVEKMKTVKGGPGPQSPSSPTLEECASFSRPSYSVGLEKNKWACNQYQSLVGVSWQLSINKRLMCMSCASCGRMETTKWALREPEDSGKTKIFFYRFVYLFGGGSTEGERNSKQTSRQVWECGSPCLARCHDPEITDHSWNQEWDT